MLRLMTFLSGVVMCSLAIAQIPADILKHHFKDYGQDTWNEIPDVTIDGRWVNTNYQGFPIKLTWSPPDMLRIEGKDVGIRAFDGTEAWSQTSVKGAKRMNATQEMILRNSFFPGSPMYPFREHLVFQGLAEMEGVLYNTFLLNESVYQKTFYIDQKDHKLYYVTVETKMEFHPIKLLVVYEKYKRYGSGLLVPTAVKFEGVEVDEELVYDQFYMGLGARKSLFTFPKGQD